MAWWTWGRLTGALVRRVPASIVNVSARGCLIQTAAPLRPGEVGLLEVDADASRPEAVRVCHAVERPGGALPYCAGTEFLVLDAASPTSIRGRVGRLEAGEQMSRLARAGENSDTRATTTKARGRPVPSVPGDMAGEHSKS
jgi:hypothetical protein